MTTTKLWLELLNTHSPQENQSMTCMLESTYNCKFKKKTVNDMYLGEYNRTMSCKFNFNLDYKQRMGTVVMYKDGVHNTKAEP